MSEKLDALRNLLAKVEAGEPAQDDFTAAFPDAWPRDAMRAYHDNSLDAAKALHEAVLPGHRWNIRWNEFDSIASVVRVDPLSCIEGVTSKHLPARAWLIAILKALIAGATE